MRSHSEQPLAKVQKTFLPPAICEQGSIARLTHGKGGDVPEENILVWDVVPSPVKARYRDE